MSHSILFTGHQMDAADRKEPRFPANKEAAAKTAIKLCLLQVTEKYHGPFLGIAGAASGGDILFHESCIELGIPSELYLAFPTQKFKQKSVSFAGRNWEDRFDNLSSSHSIHVFPEDKGNSINIWERANQWMLEAALKNGGEKTTVLALWDGEAGDGQGGTEHMVRIAKEKGLDIIEMDINKL